MAVAVVAAAVVAQAMAVQATEVSAVDAADAAVAPLVHSDVPVAHRVAARSRSVRSAMSLKSSRSMR